MPTHHRHRPQRHLLDVSRLRAAHAGGGVNRQHRQRAGLRRVAVPQAGYSASKAGVVGMTRDLAQQWSGRRGIRVNALCPGFVESEITMSEGVENLLAMVADNSPSGGSAGRRSSTPRSSP